MDLLWFVNLALLVLTVLMLAVSYARGTMDLFSFQSAFQAGMILFFYIPFLLVPYFPELRWPYIPNGSGNANMAGALVLFNVVYHIFGALGKRANWPDRVTPTYAFLPVNIPALAVMTTGMLVSSILILALALDPGAMNLFGAVMIGLIPMLGAFACGLATLMVIRQYLNVLWYVVLAGVFVAAILASTSFSNDRRFALGVLISVPWMLYYGLLRFKGKPLTIGVSAVGGVLTLGFVMVYSSFRHDIAASAENVGQRVEQFQDAKLGNALDVNLAIGLMLQDSAYNSMYCVENYPGAKDHRPLHGLMYMLTNPIPRAVFPAKPMALGMLMQEELNAAANLGPGIIGHGWMEAGWLGVIYYAAFFGFGIAAADKLIRGRSNNPYFIAAMGSSMGNVLALPRGETALFMVLIVFGLIGIWIFSWIIAKTVGAFTMSTPPFEFGEAGTQELSDGFEDNSQV